MLPPLWDQLLTDLGVRDALRTANPEAGAGGVVMLGRYIIERRVGAGAMGIVFEGFDTELVSYALPQWSAAIQGYLGAVGVSGVKSSEDVQIAKAGIAALGL